MTLDRASAFAVVVAAGLTFFTLPLADNDLWGHVRFGLEMLEQGALPSTNLFSFTAPAAPWINHEILAELAFAVTWSAAGATGLLVLKLALGIVVLFALWRTALRRVTTPLAAAVGVAAGASLSSFGFLVRPQLFTFVALAFLWNRLHAWADGDRRLAWAIPLTFALWTNTHGGVLAGALVLATFTLVAVLRDRSFRAHAPLLAVGVASALAMLVNPYGLDLVFFLLEDVQLVRPITEWHPIPFDDLSNPHFKATLAILGAAFVLGVRRPAWEVVTVGLLAILAFRHERHLPLFGIVVVPWIAVVAERGARAVGSRLGLETLSRGARVALLGGTLVLAVRQAVAFTQTTLALDGGIYVDPQEYPVNAVEFLQRNDLGGNVVVPFDWGEYVIWHRYPESRVNVDGRYTTAYPPDVLEDAFRFSFGLPGWERALVGAELVLVGRRHVLARALSRSDGWIYVYADPTAVIFVRRGAVDPFALRREWPARSGRYDLFP